MIQHFTEEGRRVYTADEAATLRGEKTKTLQTRLVRAKVRPAGQINRQLNVYYPEDLGIGRTTAMKTWTLSTDVSRDSLQTALADLGLGWLAQHISGANDVTLSMISDKDHPPADLETVRKALIERGDKASY